MVHGLFIGQSAGRLPGRRHAVAVRPGRAGIGLHEVPGELGQRDIAAAGPLGLELHAEPLVQPGPVRSGQLVVGVLAEQVMGEAVAAGAVLAEHAGPHRLVQ